MDKKRDFWVDEEGTPHFDDNWDPDYEDEKEDRSIDYEPTIEEDDDCDYDEYEV